MYRARFENNAAELEAALALVRKAAQSPDLIAETGKGLVNTNPKFNERMVRPSV